MGPSAVRTDQDRKPVLGLLEPQRFGVVAASGQGSVWQHLVVEACHVGVVDLFCCVAAFFDDLLEYRRIRRCGLVVGGSLFSTDTRLGDIVAAFEVSQPPLTAFEPRAFTMNHGMEDLCLVL